MFHNRPRTKTMGLALSSFANHETSLSGKDNNYDAEIT